jgi:hypothetical protein
MGYVDKSDRMSDNCGIWCAWKWIKSCSFTSCLSLYSVPSCFTSPVGESYATNSLECK